MKKLSLAMISMLGMVGCSLSSEDVGHKLEGGGVDNKSQGVQTQMPLPRDPQIAVQEEFDAAKQKNSVAAWELFLQRHPNNILTSAARSHLEALGVARTK